VRRADNLTTFMCRLSRNLGASTSWNPVDLSRPVMGLLYLLHISITLIIIRRSFIQNFKTQRRNVNLFARSHTSDEHPMIGLLETCSVLENNNKYRLCQSECVVSFT
jgi:hypothetical protein